MSQGNDAFSAKDAATDAGSTSDRDESGSKPAKADETEKQGRPRAESDEADEEREDSEAQSAEREERASPRGERRSSSRRNARDDEDEPRPPETEEAINVPKMQTVYMLGAMSALTIILWFAAKLTCNVHPDQVRPPKHFSTRDLAADPKNAAFEFHHNFETGDYTTALDLSTSEMRRTVEAKLKECEQHPDDCAKNQQKLAGSIESTGRVLDRAEDRATVELESHYKSTPVPKTFSFTVVKEGDFWRVASRRDVPTTAAQQAGPGTTEAASAAPPSQPMVESPDQAPAPQ